MSRVADNVADVWYNTLNSSPDQGSKICLRSVEFPDNAYTYAEVDALSNQVAHWALSKGLKPRDVVALFMENRPAYIITWLGLAKVGVTSAWINSNNKMKPLIHSITICKAKLFFVPETNSRVKSSLFFPRFVTWVLSCMIVEDLEDLQQIRRLRVRYVSICLICLIEKKNSHTTTTTHTQHIYISYPRSVRVSLVQRRLNFCQKQSSLNKKDTFAYIYTSGTTGLPKACVITHQKYIGSGSTFCAIY